MTDGGGKLFAGQVLVTNPPCNHCQILDHRDATECIFFHRVKPHRATAFTQSFLLPAEAGVDQTKHAQRRAVIWLSLDDFLLLCPCSGDSWPRSLVVPCHASANDVYTCAVEPNVVGRT